MILLTVIAVGLLSLSAVSLRSSGQSSAQQQARANARLALMLAIGELQIQMGPDQRISANAAILDTSPVSHTHWMGSWNSWHADSSDGVDSASQHRTITGGGSGLAPTYDTKREDHFRSWLVSLPPSDAGKLSSARNLTLDGKISPAKADTAVRLVGAGSLGTTGAASDFVNAQLIPLRGKSSGSSPSGRFGWWVGDESQKARIVGDSYALSDKLTLADRIFRHQAPGSTGTTSVEGLENLSNEDNVDGSDNTDQRQLTKVPSLTSLAFLTNGGGKSTPTKNFHTITPYSYQVLSDVREGGLKRDLSTLLERPISTGETSDDSMLYRFGQESVPIQDLAAYYQLYRNKGTLYASNVLEKGIQTTAPDFKSSAAFREEYSNLYRMPVPIRLQFELSLIAKPRPVTVPPTTLNTDTHLLHVGITPSVTLWNPYNIPLIMNYSSNPEQSASLLRLFNLPLSLQWRKNGTILPGDGVSLGDIVGNASSAFTLFFSGKRSIAFQPGEVRVFSLSPNASIVNLKDPDKFDPNLEVIADYDPNQFLKMPRSATREQFKLDMPADSKESKNYHKEGSDYALTFKDGDKISVSVTAANSSSQLSQGNNAFEFFMRQSVMSKTNEESMCRQYHLSSRMDTAPARAQDFNNKLMAKGFPKGKDINFGSDIRGTTLIKNSTKIPERGYAFLQFTLAAGGETKTGGRQFVSRPFLHSSAITGGSFIDSFEPDSLYQNGWNWSVAEARGSFSTLSETGRDGKGFYGGGYTSATGYTNVVQQEVPIVPPISIAALSHAQLGGFSIARAALGSKPADFANNYQKTTASGNGGLFPRTLQAIGNSYAHPYLRPDEAHGTWTREILAGAGTKVTFADHSYLANKALWDDYFFSSITPANTRIFEGTSSASQVAEGFFFNQKPLPNRRMTPYLKDFDKAMLNQLVTTADKATDGFADQIASRLMVQGAFNVNSTSVAAWKIFFSSLKDKKIAYLGMSRSLTDNEVKLYTYPDPAASNEIETVGVPVSSFSLPNGRPYQGSPTDTSDRSQWADWRQLTDNEINDLATAMVKQVKLRGPFLSLSEFVNRRLDSGNKSFSLKGALQAALDDPAVSINSGFRSADRQISSSDTAGMNPAFQEALEGPVAYGSAAYVDQADVLRNCAELLTPRGDTFVIRTYGDALDANGNVQAKAWCEAVVQRVPEYISKEDQAHLKQSDLNAPENKNFGRKLEIMSMRYLSETEV
ncbi:MAG: hypothetical protein QE267_09560 [Akkermansiaceae bacterium]|nr:hypothetical protein [Akkermansiaceae bacterium]